MWTKYDYLCTVWDDAVLRSKYVKRYAEYYRKNKN